MKMVCNLQRRIRNCGGIMVELFGRNQLWWFWRWWLILGLTGRAMDESWRGQRSWLSLRSSWVKSLSAELTLPGRANHGCEAWRE
jgi:hypothetical protein